jgi:hypothetical protein
LSERQRYRLIELLDPEVTHYEFFLGRPPVAKADWLDDEALLRAIPELSPCVHGWPSEQVFDYNYQLVSLSIEEFEFLQACSAAVGTPPPNPLPVNGEGGKSVGEILAKVGLGLDGVRSLQRRQLVLLTPG